ncbi:MAG TPA: NAD(P)H-dependent oxidoreductase [Arachidicoccus sp.]|nr:NAD(P)H-dependent oxidoreductase [Arachidicoccus sp.]
METLRILTLIGSTKPGASNHKLVNWLQRQAFIDPAIKWSTFDPTALPYFNPDLDIQENAAKGRHLPDSVQRLREQLKSADGLLICTPEYVFSLPGVLKNALEWLVSTTLLENMPTALITAAASGDKAQTQLGLVLRTLGAKFNSETNLLIKGIKGKIDLGGALKDRDTIEKLIQLMAAFTKEMHSSKNPSTARA